MYALLTIEWGASARPKRFRPFDASHTVLVLDKLRSPLAASRLSYGASVLSVIRITNLSI
jgi:hypothetical protein